MRQELIKHFAKFFEKNLETRTCYFCNIHFVNEYKISKTEYKNEYAPEVLEAFDNKHPNNDYWVTFECPEFTSLCPITGQPDFATIHINYIPDVKMVESKSLKLYLFSFRNHGAFHEDCVNIMMKDLIELMNPKYIEDFKKVGFEVSGFHKNILPEIIELKNANQ